MTYSIEEINARIPKESYLRAIHFVTNIETASGRSVRAVLCQCKCGSNVVKKVSNVMRIGCFSCGCLVGETNRKKSRYSHIIKGIQSSYNCMIGRCYRPSNPNYRFYGARGVIVCDEWKNDYQNFLDWSLKNGWQHGYQIDKDIKGDGFLYSPETCSWVSRVDNIRAQKGVKKFVYKGEVVTYSILSERYGISNSALRDRVERYGYTIEGAIERKYSPRKNKTPLKYFHNGSYYTIVQLAGMYSLNSSTLKDRIEYGWDLEKALKTPARKGKYNQSKQP